MRFELESAIAILARTPRTLNALLRDLPDAWTRANEGAGTWSPFDVVGHLIHGERTDWIPRAEIILAGDSSRVFEPFDRFAHLDQNKGRSLDPLLDLFQSLRDENITTLRGFNLTSSDFGLTARHPDLGTVTLGQLISTWVVHDLDHIGQIARAMSKQYSSEVGPWREYLPILGR